MEDVLDLGEERRRGPATSVRTVAGAGGGRRVGARIWRVGRDGSAGPAPGGASCGRSQRPEPHCGRRRGGGGFARPAPGPRGAQPGVRFL